MKNYKVRTAVLAATAALLVLPAYAGGLGGALGGSMGGNMGGALGGSLGSPLGGLGGSGMANGGGQGGFDSDLGGRTFGRLHETRERATDRSTNLAGGLTERTKEAGGAVKEKFDSKAHALGDASVGVAKEAATKTQSTGESATAPAEHSADSGIAADGLIGGAAGAQTRKHEVLLDGESAGAASADRSGVDANVSPRAAAKAGRKTPAAEPASTDPAAN